MMRNSLFSVAVLLLVFGFASADSDFGSEGSSFSCASADVDIQSNAGAQVTVGSTTIYTGYHQQSSINQNPVIARFDSGVRVWCRDDYETTGDDGDGIGLYFDGTMLYGVFTATGTQPGPNYTRWTGDGWLSSYSQGGGAKVSIILRIDPASGEPNAGTYVRAQLSNGNTNSLTVKGLALTDAGTLLIRADSWFSPLNTDKSRMSCSGSSPFDYTLELSGDLSTALGAAAVNCVDNSPEPGALPTPGNIERIAPADGATIESGAVTFSWQADAAATRYRLYAGYAGGLPQVIFNEYNAAAICTGSTCGVTVDIWPFGVFDWYVNGGNDLAWSSNWGSAPFSFTYGPTGDVIFPEDNATVSMPQDWSRLSWAHDNAFAGYDLYIGYPTGGFFYNVLNATDICTADMCTVNVSQGIVPPVNGDYVLWLRGTGANGSSAWLSRTFSYAYSQPVAPSNINGSANAISWLASGGVYFQVFVGSLPNYTPVYFEWVQNTASLCSDETCTLQLPSELSAGDYEVYIRSWNPAGMSTGGINGAPEWGMGEFTVSGQ